MSDKAKKILIIDNSSWNIYNFRLGLVKELKAEGYLVQVATPVDEYIHYLNTTHFTKHIPLKQLDRNGKNPIKDVLFFFELFRSIRSERPDLVINFTIKPNIYGSLAARFNGVSTISVITGLGYSFIHQHGLMRIVPILFRLAFKKLKYLIVYNHTDHEELLKRSLIDPTRCKVIMGDGIDTEYFKPISPEPDTIEKQPFVFLFIGRLLTDKGIKEYVEAAKKLLKSNKSVECWVLGDLNFGNPADISKTELVDWIDNKYIKYFGTSHDVRPFIENAHALVLPSYREGMSRVILEAMAMGKPIITTEVAGCSETVVEGVNGLKVPARNATALYHAMDKLQSMNRYRLLSMGQKSREMALELFDKRVILKHYLRLIKNALLTKSPSSAKQERQFDKIED